MHPFIHPSYHSLIPFVYSFINDTVYLFTGTDTDSFAGLRACKCLNNFYRTDLFNACIPCEDDGLECADDIATLKAGFWWVWENETHKNKYKEFTKSHLNATVELNKQNHGLSPIHSFTKYDYKLPKPLQCPRKESCTGGIDSKCDSGYEGPLCEVCSDGYYKQLQTCKQCPTKIWMVGQLSVLVAIITIVIAIVVWTSKKKSKKIKERSSVDIIFGRLKIVIGFYQVTFGLLEAFSYIQWPDSLALIGKYSEILQLNVLHIAPIHCLFPGLKVNAFTNLFATLALNAAAIIFALAIYGIRKLCLMRSTLDDKQKAMKASQTKELVYRNLFFLLYVTYLSTCCKTARVLPLACHTLCFYENKEDCPRFLKTDFSVSCDSRSKDYYRLVILAYVAVGYVLFLPTVSLVALLRQRKQFVPSKNEYENEDSENHREKESTEILTGLRFLFENYNPRTWYWEFIDTMRKIVLTSGLILMGGESRVYVGLACIISSIYAVFFALQQPIADPFENTLMLTSLVVTFVNLGIGAVSRIPSENSPVAIDQYTDTMMFKIFVFGANALVIALLGGEYMLKIISRRSGF